MKISVLALTALMVATPAISKTALDSIRPYIGIKTGISDLSNNPNGLESQRKNVWMNAVSVGVRTRAVPYSKISTELEYTYRPNLTFHDTGNATVDAKSWSVMLNGMYALDVFPLVKPFVSAGVGMTRHDRTVKGISAPIVGRRFAKRAADLTWSVGTGIDFEVTSLVDLSLGYRYMDMGRIRTGRFRVDVQANEYYIGLRYQF